MNILIATPLFPPDIGGPATYSKILVDELPKHGVTVSVLSFGSVRRLPKIVSHLAYFFLLMWKGRRADIIFAQDPVSVGLPAFAVAKLLQKHFFLKIVGDYAWEQGTQRFGVTETLDAFAKKTEGYQWMVRMLKGVQCFVARRAEKVVVPSAYLKKIVTAWGVPAKSITVVYNSFEPPRLSGNRSVLRGLLQFDGELLISAGRLVPWKGFAELIEIMPRLKKAFPRLKLMIIGEGPDQKKLEHLIEKKHLENVVVLAGRLPHDVLIRYFEAADLFVLNTSYEGFSHQLLEAMAVGTPIVTTNVGGNPELIVNGVSGLLVRQNDREALRRAIERMLTEEGLRTRLTAGAREKIRSFSKEKMSTALVLLFTQSV